MGDRYYGGTMHVDQMELLCQKRALDLYSLNNEECGVNDLLLIFMYIRYINEAL
ncbi:hypothetical protein T552_04139 [Pneumocystis carinii B80]|uniref:Serine hydroxymethyltransferase-like domain-containing protein n=1 Tax=Pneumocystis carinii (strain B80) TaxID=1408658 RepID=A0A0W4ZIB5_PNEC8|nr:hypothetical protein T552_04139 [Pneumocystis carinii B80]KTW28125.1 hypothetical protein T552_04139 [Pneumocystis carinii B80]